jgi:hypothetical protein
VLDGLWLRVPWLWADTKPSVIELIDAWRADQPTN